jgi:hypothetical protein
MRRTLHRLTTLAQAIFYGPYLDQDQTIVA